MNRHERRAAARKSKEDPKARYLLSLDLQARAAAFYSVNRFEEALSESKRAQALDPANADICLNIGTTMHKLARYEDALEQFDRALALRPDFVPALHNKATALA